MPTECQNFWSKGKMESEFNNRTDYRKIFKRCTVGPHFRTTHWPVSALGTSALKGTALKTLHFLTTAPRNTHSSTCYQIHRGKHLDPPYGTCDTCVETWTCDEWHMKTTSRDISFTSLQLTFVNIILVTVPYSSSIYSVNSTKILFDVPIICHCSWLLGVLYLSV